MAGGPNRRTVDWWLWLQGTPPAKKEIESFAANAMAENVEEPADAMDACRLAKAEAASHFSRGDLATAHALLLQGYRLVEPLLEHAAPNEAIALSYAVTCNLSAASLQLGRHGEAVHWADRAITLGLGFEAGLNARGHFRKVSTHDSLIRDCSQKQCTTAYRYVCAGQSRAVLRLY